MDISKLKIGENIAVETLKQDNLTFLHPDSSVVVQVKMARAAVVVEDEEEEELEGEAAEGAEGAEAPAAEGAEAPAESNE